MTIQELIDEAAKLGGWYLDSVGRIRRNKPIVQENLITAVYDSRNGTNTKMWDEHKAGYKLGLSKDAIAAITDATEMSEPPRTFAESFRVSATIELRARLMHALGIVDKQVLQPSEEATARHE